MNYYFVGAIWNGKEDKTEEFVNNGYWQMGFDPKDEPKISKQIRQMKEGEWIAIKSTTVQKNNLPFNSPKNRSVSKMPIKAIGQVTRNRNDGLGVDVAWKKNFMPKDWYFFTYRRTFWKINEKNKWWNKYAKKLVDFAFFGADQNYDFFLKNWSWPEGDEVEYEALDIPDSSLNRLNQILYGPPGTGKTYSTVKQTMHILAPGENDYPDSIQALKERFPAQVEFVTFHQSFSYEDFVEGLQAKSKDGQISYEVEDGVFKRLCQSNLHYPENVGKYRIQRVTEELVVLKKPSSAGELCLPKVYLDRLIDFENQGLISQEDVKKKRVFDKLDQNQARYFEKYILNGYPTLWADLMFEFNSREVTNEPIKKVLIIDEINRGNISRIFGELITLIEESKRAGNEEAVSVQLPYSKEPFSVPNNLYIIGTMNTADRSLALMDTALRRRFDFIEMMPDLRLVTEDLDGVNVRQMLGVMNQRIAALYDREHTLGHAFLMNLESIEELRAAFKNKILPLLEEYFFDDWEKIRLVLGNAADAFYRAEEISEGLFVGENAPNGLVSYERQPVESVSAESFQQIYQGV